MKKITSILLACLLLLSSVGITHAQHFCGEHMMLSKITLGETSLSCGMAVKSDRCKEDFKNASVEKEEHKCCDTTYTKVVTDDSFSPSDFSFQLPVVFVEPSFVTFSVEDELPFLNSSKDYYRYYYPPPNLRDYQVLYATFLI